MGRGEGVGDNAASITLGTKGVLHGFESYLLQDAEGAPQPVYSIASGLDYPSVGPEHAFLHDVGRVRYESVSDDEAMEAFYLLCRLEGIIPALEPSHALAHVMKIAPALPKDHIIVMNMCGRGDKDIFTVARHLGVQIAG